MKGCKKDRGGLVKRVEEFVLPSLKLNKDKIEEIPNVSTSPSYMFQKLSLMVDQKLVAAQHVAGDMFAKMNNEVDALKVKKPMDESYSSDPSSATPAFTSEPIYGMPPNSFPEQTPPPSSVYTTPVGPIPPTGQTGYPTGQSGDAGMTLSPTLLEIIPGSAARS